MPFDPLDILHINDFGRRTDPDESDLLTQYGIYPEREKRQTEWGERVPEEKPCRVVVAWYELEAHEDARTDATAEDTPDNTVHELCMDPVKAIHVDERVGGAETHTCDEKEDWGVEEGLV